MDKEDPIWGAVIAADGQYGDEAESQARHKAVLATEADDMREAAIWNAVADTLHILHSINRRPARRRDNPSARRCGDRALSDRGTVAVRLA